LRQKLSILFLGLLIFVAGVQTGNGNFAVLRSSSSNKGLPANLDYSGVERIYDQLRVKYDGQLTVDQLQDGLKKGLVAASGDPYTEYMPPKEAKDFDEQLSGSFEGIGAELGKDKDSVIIVSPISGTPAAKAGLRPKDAIVQINGKDATGLSVEEARNKIRGPKGTQVKLTIIRDGQKLDLTITRDTITIPSVESKILDGNIGYLKVSRFSDDTAALTTTAAAEFKQKNVKGVILDLRGDPGGYLEAAVNVASLWLPSNKTVLQERRGGTTTKTYTSLGTATLQGIPTIALIDEGSASASEITAGALRDNGAATLLGVKSFGKGSVQEPMQLNDGSLLKITVARWYTPNGKNIDKQGITPDQKVERTDNDYQAGRDPQLDVAIAKLK
jgi:carboxyl-terminal processing protease